MTTTMDIPGRYLSFFDGSDVAAGKPDSETGYVGGEALVKALRNGTRIKRGRHGYVIRITLADDVEVDVLRVLWDYGDVSLDANADTAADTTAEASERSAARAEMSAARTVMQRALARLTELGATLEGDPT